jgi:hypothetical protein
LWQRKLLVFNYLNTYDEAHGRYRRIFNNLRNPYDQAHGPDDEAHGRPLEGILQLVDLPADKDLTTAGFASILVFFCFGFKTMELENHGCGFGFLLPSLLRRQESLR